MKNRLISNKDFKKFRLKAGLGLSKAAGMLGVKPSELCNYEHGRTAKKTICKKCQNLTGVASCKTSELGQDYVTGRITYMGCCLINKDGNCPHYKPASWFRRLLNKV